MLAHAETAALRRALEIAADPAVPLGPNPRVGCVLLDAHGAVIAEGHHRGAGTPHAEIDALSSASVSVAGATALVTLEPCAHHGRTGPCADALLEAGVARVVVARRDPNPLATGGVETLRAAGVDVELDVPEDLAAAAGLLNRGWEHGLQHDRPLVTAKTALTLDGRVAAADGSSRWITGEEARSEVHDLRAACDVVLIGTGTAWIDHPSLTARRPDGTLLPHQPLRVVMGTGDIPSLPAPAGAGDTLHLRTRDPSAALAELFAQGRRHVLLEGGPTVTGAFLRAGLVDELIVHLAPTLLGAGPPGVGDLGITTISERLDLDLVEVAPRGRDLRLTLRPRTA
ncbi:bifunctional diaminohydroxyphosphoribosylaminopyrimidine deaminase/5-amino-6-(5-phosphoribosylamino)uracil reductase RibD [Brachybacterium alimentarium]|uniref:bifunctional diaminohydroxyphosphoribosylaminopyrimidine deaminase/5-amino-6-(5-phosphoribosylamino)uracil reductase RibD n=1 Tax=Brachybacterium alimentarium TaxID=47845 RepID=UPI003FD63AAC